LPLGPGAICLPVTKLALREFFGLCRCMTTSIQASQLVPIKAWPDIGRRGCRKLGK